MNAISNNVSCINTVDDWQGNRANCCVEQTNEGNNNVECSSDSSTIAQHEANGAVSNDYPSLERAELRFSQSEGSAPSIIASTICDEIDSTTDEQSSINSISTDELKDMSLLDEPDTDASSKSHSSFMGLRCTYLLVTMVVMLADGLQGTHLYVLYEGYGFSVASLYCLGFFTGGLMSPITGPLVDKIGRKKAAILYCLFEILINMLEQYPFFAGLVISRMIGGFTTNLLSSVFEAWLDTEYRKRGFEKEKYEIIMRDSVIVSNLAAIFSGYLAHVLAENYGNVGPFEGAVTCTTIALVVVLTVWTENYGTSEGEKSKGMIAFMKEAVECFRQDNRMLRVGIIQGLTAGSIQLFVFLWTPTLRHFAQAAPYGYWGLDKDGEPAYGLIFGAFMGAGVLGGLVSPQLRRGMMSLLSPICDSDAPVLTVEFEGTGASLSRPMAAEFLACSCYFLAAIMFFVPCLLSDGGQWSFSICLVAFVFYELVIGVFLPCEGVIRSLYFPTSARASIMALPRIIVNGAVSLGVFSTNYISLKSALGAVGCLMIVSAVLQLSLVSQREWSSLLSRISCFQSAFSTDEKSATSKAPTLRRWSLSSASPSSPVSDCSALSEEQDPTVSRIIGCVDSTELMLPIKSKVD